MMLHPFRSAPFTVAGHAGPPRKFPTRGIAVVAVVALLLHGRTKIGAAMDRNDARLAHQAACEASRAEQNARAWVRSAYGVDPWVRCGEGDYYGVATCDVVVNHAAPFRLTCETHTGGACGVVGGR